MSEEAFEDKQARLPWQAPEPMIGVPGLQPRTVQRSLTQTAYRTMRSLLSGSVGCAVGPLAFRLNAYWAPVGRVVLEVRLGLSHTFLRAPRYPWIQRARMLCSKLTNKPRPELMNGCRNRCHTDETETFYLPSSLRTLANTS